MNSSRALFGPPPGSSSHAVSSCWDCSLIAWGLDDLAGFFADPVRVAIAMIVLVLASVQAWMAYVTPPEPKEFIVLNLVPHRLKWHSTLFEIILILAAFGDRARYLNLERKPTCTVDRGGDIFGGGDNFPSGPVSSWASHLRREDVSAVDSPVLLYKGPFDGTLPYPA